MAILLALSAPVVLTRPSAQGSDIDFWVFAHAHYEEYKPRVAEFEQRHPGTSVNLQMLPGNVETDKLMAAFLSGTGAPDLVEIEIGSIGRFFLGAKRDIGFVDLTEPLQRGGYYDRMVKARFIPWSNRGSIYGIPHDIHPVVLLYRDDLLREKGITDFPARIPTWDAFVDFWMRNRQPLLDTDGDGDDDRYALMLDQTSSRHLRLLLNQRGGDYFGPDGDVQVDSDLCLDTLLFMRRLFDEYGILFPQPAFGPDMYGPMKEDRLYCCLAPDWFIGVIRLFCPELEGKWRAAPLPAWEPGGRRTSTMGGTMIGITKQCEDFDLAWELVAFLYFDPEAAANRYEHTRIITPLRDVWDTPVYNQPDRYVGGQKLAKLLAGLGDDVPAVYQDQYSAECWQLMDKAAYRVLTNPDADAKAILREVAEKVRGRIEHDRFRTWM
ncbi:MAG: ABC transporter substrate-binding protein [Armatimonadota bacterium]